MPLADGSLGRALELLDGSLSRWRAAVLTGLEKLTPATGLQFGLSLWALAEAEGPRLFAEEKGTERQETPRAAEGGEELEPAESEIKSEAGWKRHVFRGLLEMCELCFRDGLICAACGTGAAPEARGGGGGGGGAWSCCSPASSDWLRRWRASSASRAANGFWPRCGRLCAPLVCTSAATWWPVLWLVSWWKRALPAPKIVEGLE